MKLSLEDKKEIVRLYFDEHYGFRTIGKKFSIRASNVSKIINGYKIHGEAYLIHPPKMHNYSPEFKESIIKQVLSGKSKTSLAAEYGILGGSGAIVMWMHKYEKLGYNGLVSKKRGRQKMKNKPIAEEEINKSNENTSSPLTDAERLEFEELKKKYKELQKEKELSDMENEFLKKLDTLVRERLKQEKKK